MPAHICVAVAAATTVLVLAGSAAAQDQRPIRATVQTEPLRITVLDPDGKPARGALVEVLRFPGGDAFYSNLEISKKHEHRTVAKLPTPKSGSVGIQVPVALPHRVRVDAAPYAIEYRRDVFAGEELTIQLRPGAVLTGIVRDTDGAPLTAEKVEVLPTPRAAYSVTPAGADGRFRFERLMPGQVYVRAESTLAAIDRGQRLVLESGETREIEFALDRGAELRGRIVDATTKKPIAGVEIGVGWTFDKPVFSDPDGRYSLHGLGGPFSNNIFARAPGYCKLQLERPKEKEGVVARDLELHKGLEVSGRILDYDGRPVPDCYVAVVGMTHSGSRQETDWRSVRTDQQGRFSIGDLRRELSPVLLVRCELRATLVLPIPEPGQHEKLVLDDVKLRPRRIAQGVLLAADGTPLVGEKVQLKGANRDAPDHAAGGDSGLAGILGSYLAQRETVTDSRGRFFFGDLAAGSYSLTVDGNSHEIEVEADKDPEPLEIRR